MYTFLQAYQLYLLENNSLQKTQLPGVIVLPRKSQCTGADLRPQSSTAIFTLFCTAASKFQVVTFIAA